MLNPTTPRFAEPARLIDDPFDGIVETQEFGLSILGPETRRPFRRVIYVNAYGGKSILEQIRAGLLPPHHLWGCFELARNGYEVALAEPLPDFYLYRNPLPHDLKLLRAVRSWLGNDGIVYCAHNVLYWLPLMRGLGAIRSRIVSLLFAREPLKFSRAHSGIIALNRAAEEQARRLAPRAKVAHLGWGVDLSVFPVIPYQPQWFLSCGITHRDHHTLSAAAAVTAHRIRVISRTMPADVSWPANVSVLTGADGGDAVTYQELLRDQYSRCAASLILLDEDPTQYTGVGMTSLIEAMAMARPVIVTRTGALPTELDVAKEGCGLFVPPNDPDAVADALNFIVRDPDRARRMGAKGRQLCESHYNIQRYARELDHFFHSL
jgi:glycosyltransferase involved in cell wall biosynthesis